ncbi:MAG: hypothetical protein CMP81_20240 [Fulvimarina sp.]|nr:hypothetical protein [Fulvimarina sp.]
MLGAVLALGGAWLLASNGMLPGLGGPQQNLSDEYVTKDALNQEIATLRGEGAAAGSTDGAPAIDLSPLEQRIAALEASTADIATLKETADKAGTTATSAGEAAASAQQSADALMEASDRTAGQAADAVSQAASASQAAAAAQQAATNAQQTANSAQQTAQSSLEKADAASSAANSANEAAEAASAKVDGALADLEQRVAGIEQSNQRAEVALAAANLKSAIDAGGPFADQLETFAKTAGAGATTESLRTFAAEGVPSERQLAAQWPEVETKISNALSPPRPNAPVGDQMLAGLRSLVQVRPTGSAPASDTSDDAVLSRLNAAVRSGDLEAFRAQWEDLPDAAKDVSRDFADKVKARLTAEEIVSSTLSGAISGSQPSSSDAAEPANQG